MRKGLLVLAAVLVVAGTTRADILEVGSGKTYSSIQTAVDAAAGGTMVYSNHDLDVPGDEIVVYAGTYAGFTVTGNSKDLLTIKAYKNPADCNSVAERVIITSPIHITKWAEGQFIQGFYLANVGSGACQSTSCGRMNTWKNLVIYGGGSAAIYGNAIWGNELYDHCTIYDNASVINVSSYSTVNAMNSVVGYNAAAGSANGPASYCDFFNNPNPNAGYTEAGWTIGAGSISIDPMFVSLDPDNPHFLWLHEVSPAVGIGALPSIGNINYLLSSTPANQGTLPRLANNQIKFVTSGTIDPCDLPAVPLRIVEFDSTTDLAGSFSYSLSTTNEPNDTLVATETGTVLADKTWYHIESVEGWVVPFTIDLAVLRGDIDNDGQVLETDYSLLVHKWSHSGPDLGRIDLDADNDIDMVDLSVLLGNWAEYLEALMGFNEFADQAASLGLGINGNNFYAAAWMDNNDGWPDLCVDGRIYRNQSGGDFLMGVGIGRGVWADLDHDGFDDVFTFLYDDLKVYRKVPGTGYFDELPFPALPATISEGACWADFDGDAYLDIYASGYETQSGDATYPDRIFMNNNGLSFDLTWSETVYRGRGVTACDFDEDGDIDIYVSNYRLQPNRLWGNNGSGFFTDIAGIYGVAGDPGGSYPYGHTIGSAWGDLDNDGHFDLFVGNFRHNWGDGSQDYPKFYRNRGPGNDYKFEDMTAGAGLAWQESFASPALGDYDNDGDLDLYYTTVYAGDNPVLYRNEGNWTFVNVTNQAGLSGLRQTYQAAWADFDHDGDLDLLTDGKLFVNSGNFNRWLEVRLIGDGTTVNRSAIGTQVRIDLGDKIIARQVEAGTSNGNQNDMTLHFGLGAHSDPVTLEITWPDGTVQIVSNVAVNQLLTIEK